MSFARACRHASAGVAIWAAHFAFVYALTAWACERGGWIDALPESVGAATLVAAAACIAVAWRGLVPPRRFERRLGAGLAALAFVAIVWEGVGAMMLGPCG